MKKTWRVLKKHEHVYPPHRPNFWLVLKSKKIFIIWKTKQEIGKNIFVNFQWPGKPGFPQKIQVYIVPVNWFVQLNFLFFYIFDFLFLFFSFFYFFYFLVVSDQLRSRWRKNTDVSIQHLHFLLLWKLLYKICLIDRFIVQLEPVAIDHKLTCFIIDGLKFDWAIVIDFNNLIWAKLVSCEFGFEIFELWVKQ